MQRDRDAVMARLQSWLRRANPAAEEISTTTDIIESRMLESLQVVEFILYLESECRRPILSEDLDPNDLRTLDSIYRRFFEECA